MGTRESLEKLIGPRILREVERTLGGEQIRIRKLGCRDRRQSRSKVYDLFSKILGKILLARVESALHHKRFRIRKGERVDPSKFINTPISAKALAKILDCSHQHALRLLKKFQS